MKTIIKTSLAFLFFAAIASCTKENIKPAATQQSTNQSASQTANAEAVAGLRIGDKYGGGYIFYLDSTKQHGLVAAPSDLTVNRNTQIKWYNGSYVFCGTLNASIGKGKRNTFKIIGVQGTGNYAAKLCADLVLNGFTDWFLPSKGELNQLYKQRAKVPGLAATNYWSSTEYDANNAWDQEFGGGFQFADDKSFTLRIRAIRSF